MQITWQSRDQSHDEENGCTVCSVLYIYLQVMHIPNMACDQVLWNEKSIIIYLHAG